MSQIAIEIVMVLLLILANGVLAMAEIAVVSARKVRLQQRAKAGDEGAAAALDLADNPSDFLSTVQIGITLVGILAGAFGGATLAEYLDAALAQVPVLAPYSGALSVGLVVVLITYLTLILGELVPKRLALRDTERVAAAVGRPMRSLSRWTAPLVSLLSLSTDLVLRLFGGEPEAEPPVTEEEIKVLIEQGTVAGVFPQVESEMVNSIFRLGDRRIDTIMTPRTEIYWLDFEDANDVNRQKITGSIYSRLPVARGNLDNIMGLVQAKSLLANCLEGATLDLQAALIAPQFVPESAPALSVLEIFRKSGVHLALVIDEFGGLQGLVTVMDVLESIVGEIPMLGETDGPQAMQREDGSWLLDGLFPIDEFRELFQLEQLPDEKANYQTLSGLMMSGLGRIPEVGDQFHWHDLRLEVVDMDGFRVDKVLVSTADHDERRVPG